MFDYLEKIKDKKIPLEETYKMDMINNISLNSDLLKRMDFEKMSDQEITEICLNNYQQFFDDVFSDADTLTRLIVIPKFLINFSHALYSIKLSETQKTQLCNIIYVLRSKDDVIGPTKLLLLNLGKIVNRDLLPRIMDLGFSENKSADIAIARYSSKKNLVRVKRINACIIDSQNIVRIETIIKLYDILGYFSHFTDLFNGIMYDKTNNSENFSPVQRENYSCINVALVTIMEEMPSNLLYTLLLNFIEDRYTFFSGYDIRFNIASCNPTDYPRIVQTIDRIDKQNRLSIPF